jgi:hypothetical protein
VRRVAWEGPARGLSLLALAAFAGAGALLAGYALGAVATRDWWPLLLFGFGWLATALGLVLFAAALIAAALGKGRLPRWAVALGGVLLLAALVLSATSLRVTGEPKVVGAVALASAGVLVAAGVAGRRA